MSLLVDIQAQSVQVFESGSGGHYDCSELQLCASFGYFNASASSSFKTVNASSIDTYPEDRIHKDTLTIGGQRVENVPLINGTNCESIYFLWIDHWNGYSQARHPTDLNNSSLCF